MTISNTEIRQGFNQMIAAASAVGDHNAVSKMELAREYFTNSEFKSALREHVWLTNGAGR